MKYLRHISASQRRTLTGLFFGSPGEFWLGLENIHSISKQGQYILQVELSDWTGQQLPVARYRFQLDGEEKMFRLHMEDESSSGAQEKIRPTGASGLPFSTADRDNDLAANANCADLLSGTTPLASLTSVLAEKIVWVGSHPQKKSLTYFFTNIALLLQAVGGSAVVENQTSTADIPEGRERSDDKCSANRGCFGPPPRDKSTL